MNAAEGKKDKDIKNLSEKKRSVLRAACSGKDTSSSFSSKSLSLWDPRGVAISTSPLASYFQLRSSILGGGGVCKSPLKTLGRYFYL